MDPAIDSIQLILPACNTPIPRVRRRYYDIM